MGGHDLDWKTLFDMQEKLDNYILENHQLEKRSYFDEKYLALLVELGELANETRCFKYWSHKSASNKDVIIEEYVDNIHFLLSLGIEKKFQFTSITVDEKNYSQTEQFNLIYDASIRFYQDRTKDNYIKVFTELLRLARLLGFSETEIITAYHEKNKVNYERQNSGY